MKTTFVSTNSVQNALRLATQQGLAELQKLQKEVVTQRHADVGVVLGATTTRSISLARDVSHLETILDSNAVATLRLSASQGALAQMADAAQTILQSLIGVQGSDDQLRLDILKTEVDAQLEVFAGAINLSANGEYLFSGINTDAAPLAEYDAAGSAPKAAFDAAFLGHFGFDQSDVNVSTITVAQMDDFLTNIVEPMFLGADWTTDWSAASDTNMKSRISKTEVVETSANANATGFRRFAMASVMVSELMALNIDPDVRQLVNDTATQVIAQASYGIDAVRAQLGVSEARIERADNALSLQIDALRIYIGDLEGVDPYDASTRLNTLTTQLEISYSLTARLQRLSLTNYI